MVPLVSCIFRRVNRTVSRGHLQDGAGLGPRDAAPSSPRSLCPSWRQALGGSGRLQVHCPHPLPYETEPEQRQAPGTGLRGQRPTVLTTSSDCETVPK